MASVQSPLEIDDLPAQQHVIARWSRRGELRKENTMAQAEHTQSGPHTEITEQDLVQRLQAGDAETFDALFRQYFQKIFRQATHLLGNAAEAEEVVQEVFLAVYEKAHTFRGEAAFTTRLYRLTTNAAFSRLRRRKRSH